MQAGLIDTFLNLYHSLTKKFRLVFNYLQWFCKNYRSVFPSIETISEKTGVSDRTVKRATKHFFERGWLVKIKRPYQSNLYFMDDGICRLNLSNPETFKKNDPQVGPVLSSSSVSIVNGTKASTISADISEKKVPIMLKISGLSHEERVRLSDNFAEYQLAQALDDARYYVRCGNKIKCLMGFLWARAKKAIG